MRLVGVITTTVLISSYSSELCTTVTQRLAQHSQPGGSWQPPYSTSSKQIFCGESSQATRGLPRDPRYFSRAAPIAGRPELLTMKLL